MATTTKTTYTRKHAAGICSDCGCAIPVGRNHLCTACAKERRKAAMAAWKAAHPATPRKRIVAECKACGAIKRDINAEGFCLYCHDSGYEEVFKVTGRRINHAGGSTYEEIRRNRVKVEAGWRGRVVAGGGMAIEKKPVGWERV